MNIRPATRNDLPACAALDGSYQSSWVWQMEAPAQLIPQGEGEEIQVGFRTTRLPRKLEVPHRLDPIVLEWDWQHEECFLVAEEAEQVLGLLDMRIQPWERVGWVYQLVVDRPRRRQRIGTALLHAGMEWARREGLRSVMVEVSTKNYPGIQFCQRRGFTFCGYNDLYFASRDIAIFFTRSL